MKCCLCGNEIEVKNGWSLGNNPWPLSENEDDRCCDKCNNIKVIPARIELYYSQKESNTNGKHQMT